VRSIIVFAIAGMALTGGIAFLFTDPIASLVFVCICLAVVVRAAYSHGRWLKSCGSCPSCGYRLDGSRSRCPECGKLIAPGIVHGSAQGPGTKSD